MNVVTYKVPGGKLIRIKAGLEENKLLAPQISGDFFLMPPEKIELLEHAMDGFDLRELDQLKAVLDRVIKKHQIRISGMDTDDIIECLRGL